MSYKIKYAIVKKNDDLIKKLKENNFKFDISHDFLVISVKNKLKSKLKSYGVKEIVLIRDIGYDQNIPYANYINFETGETISADGVNLLLKKIGVKSSDKLDEYDYIFSQINKNSILKKIINYLTLKNIE